MYIVFWSFNIANNIGKMTVGNPIPWSGVLLNWSKNSPYFMEPWNSLPYSKEHATYPYRKKIISSTPSHTIYWT